MVVQNLSIDWDDLQIFLAVFRSGTLRGAARLVHLNHATVNRRVTALEAAFGARLFDRTPDGFAPTQAGGDLLAYAERVEDEMFQARQQIAGRDADLSGAIKLSLPYAILKGFLGPDLAAFSARYPDIHLDLQLTDGFSDPARLEADVSLRLAHAVYENVAGRRLVQYAQAIYAAPRIADELYQAAGKPDAQADTQPDTQPDTQHAWIGWQDGSGENTWVRATPYPNLPARHNLPGHALQMELARAGLGLALLPCFLGDRDPDLIRVPDTTPVPDRSIWLLLRPELRRTARVRAFADFIARAILRHRDLLAGRTA